MMKTELLNNPPPFSAIASRVESGRTLSYLEGWYVIQVANEIFGPSKWARTFTGAGLQLVFQEEKKTDKGIRYDIGYICEYKVTIEAFGVAEDVGYGIGQSYISKGDAHESAVKEAVTDALKRCLRSFGNAFGNCLYDKKWLAENAPGKKKPPKAAPKPLAKVTATDPKPLTPREICDKALEAACKKANIKGRPRSDEGLKAFYYVVAGTPEYKGVQAANKDIANPEMLNIDEGWGIFARAINDISMLPEQGAFMNDLMRLAKERVNLANVSS